MRLDFQLLLAYSERLQVLVEKHGYPPLAIDVLHEVASSSFNARLDSTTVPLSLSVLPPNEAMAQGLSWSKSEFQLPDKYIALIEGCTEYDLAALKSSLTQQGYEPSSEGLVEISREIVKTALEKLAGDFILASNIAAPGALHPTMYQCRVDGVVLAERRLLPSMISDARAEFAEIAWPPFTNLSLSSAMSWLRAIPGFEDGVPKDELGRAVTALSHLLGYEPESSGADLMWAMVGLEALYTRGKAGLAHQLREKVKVFLGEPEHHKNRFKKLYDYRSRFVHGSLDSPLAYTPYDGVEAFMESTVELSEAAITATALLLSTLQKMLAEDMNSLEFRWELVTG